MPDQNILLYILCALIAYLLGSIPFSFIFVKVFKGEDIRKTGSGNTGTTNALRSYGWKMGLLTLVCDIAKGFFSALIGLCIAGNTGMYIAAVFAVVGHNYSVYLKFKGGKGIACTTGALLMIQPIATVIIFAVCVFIVVIVKIMSVGSLLGLAASIIAAVILAKGNIAWILSVVIIAALGVIGHRENIKRLIHGNERKLNLSKKSKN